MWIIIKYYRFATLAQLAEHLIRNERVVGSNPISGSKVNKRFPDFGRPLFCIYENLAIVARFRGALAVSVVRNNKKAPNVLQYR